MTLWLFTYFMSCFFSFFFFFFFLLLGYCFFSGGCYSILRLIICCEKRKECHRRCFCCVLYLLSMFVRVLFVFDLLLILFRIVLLGKMVPSAFHCSKFKCRLGDACPSPVWCLVRMFSLLVSGVRGKNRFRKAVDAFLLHLECNFGLSIQSIL